MMSIETSVRWAVLVGGIFGLAMQFAGLILGLCRPWMEAHELAESMFGEPVFQITRRKISTDSLDPMPTSTAKAKFLIVKTFDVVLWQLKPIAKESISTPIIL